MVLATWHTLLWATLSLASAGEPAVERLTHDLCSPEAAVRVHAAVELGRLGRRSAASALVAALEDSDGGVRAAAARSLGLVKNDEAVPGLIARLGDADANVRTNAAYALGEFRHPTAVTALTEAMGDSEWSVRDQSAWALAQIGGTGVAAGVVRSLSRDAVDVEQVIWLLSRLPAAGVSDPAAELLRHANPAVRQRAVRVLGVVGGNAAAGMLEAALRDTDAQVRYTAISSLVAVSGRKAIARLQPLAQNDPDRAVRQAAADAVATLLHREDLVAHWTFDQQNSQTAIDVSGHGCDGVIIRCTSVPGRKGNALRFSGGSYVEIGKPAAFSMASGPFTVTAWIKTQAPHGVVVARGGAFSGFSLYVKNGCPRFGIQRQRDGIPAIAASNKPLGPHWTHLAGVVRENAIELYVDGQLAATAATAGYIPNNGGQGMEIGFDVANSPVEITDAFEGELDEIKVFSSALSADEIAEEAR